MLRSISGNARQLVSVGDAASKKTGSLTGGFGNLDILAVNGGTETNGAYAGTTSTQIPVLKYSFLAGDFEDAFTLTLPGAPRPKSAVSISYDTDGTLLLALSSFEDARTEVYRVTIDGSTATAVLLHTFGYALTSLSVLSHVQETAVSTNARARYAVVTKPNDATLYLYTFSNGVIEATSIRLQEANIVDSTYLNYRLYYLSRDGTMLAHDIVTNDTTAVFSKVFKEPYGLCFRAQRWYIAQQSGLWESQNVDIPRRPNTFFLRAKVQPRLEFGDRPDITFRSDEEFKQVLPAIDYFEPLTYEMFDLPVGMSFNGNTRELTATGRIQPGVYQVQYRASAPSSRLIGSDDVPGCSAVQRFSITVGAPESEGGLCIPGETPTCTFAQNTGSHICSFLNGTESTNTIVGSFPEGVTLEQPKSSSVVKRATPILNETGLQAQGFESVNTIAVNELQLHLISYSDIIDVNTFIPTIQYRLFGCENDAPVPRIYYKREVATGPLARGHNPCGPGFAGGNQVNNPRWTGWRVSQLAYIDPDTQTARVFEYNTSTETLTELLGDSTYYAAQDVNIHRVPAQARVDTAVLGLGEHVVTVKDGANNLSETIKIVATSAEIDECRALQAQPTAAQLVPLSILEEGGLVLAAANLRATTDDQQFNIALPRAVKND